MQQWDLLLIDRHVKVFTKKYEAESLLKMFRVSG